MGPLPRTFLEFARVWNKDCFPRTFDNKVLARHSKLFYKQALGDLYDKCNRDKRMSNNLRFAYDTKNGFTNYEGTEALSHYHEAAYDAHMTGVVFAHVLKSKDIEDRKNKLH